MFKGFRDLLSKVEQTVSGIDKTVNPKLNDLTKNVSEKLKPVSNKLDELSKSPVQNPVEKPTNIAVRREESSSKLVLGDQDQLNIYARDNVKMNAGIEYIEVIEKNMLILHNKNKELFAKCGDTDFKIAPVYQVVVQERDRWNQITKEFSVLPTILQNLTNMKSDIDLICDRIDKLEIALTEQLEAVATVELQTWKENHNLQLQKHKTKKNAEVASYEQELRVAFVKREQQRLELEKLKQLERLEEMRIKAREKEREDRLREQQLELERQKEMSKTRNELQQQFQKDFEAYKAYGTLPSKDTSAPAKTLEQVELPTDVSVEDFLGPPIAVTPAPIEKPSVSEEETTNELVMPVKSSDSVEVFVSKEDKVEDVDESWYT